MAEQNPLEEKIKELAERAKQLHEKEVKKERTAKAEKLPEKESGPILQKPVKSVASSIKPVYMEDIVGNVINKEERIFYTAPVHRYGRKLKVAVLSLIAAGFIGFLFVANTPYFNKWYQEKKRISSYNSQLHNIQNDIAKKRYDGIEAKVRTLANDLENEKRQQSLFAYKIADKSLEKLKLLRYIKQVKVEAKSEKRLVKEGYYEKVWVEPQYETKWKTNWFNVAIKPLYLVLNPIYTFGGQPLTEPQTKEKTSVKVKDGYYKDGEWHNPVYENVIISPAHYQKLEINPYNDTQKVIEDNIPIK